MRSYNKLEGIMVDEYNTDIDRGLISFTNGTFIGPRGVKNIESFFIKINCKKYKNVFILSFYYNPDNNIYKIVEGTDDEVVDNFYFIGGLILNGEAKNCSRGLLLPKVKWRCFGDDFDEYQFAQCEMLVGRRFSNAYDMLAFDDTQFTVNNIS
jgi:hypothetical protein